MSLKAYISFVELPTKIASIIPFIMGIAYSLYRYNVADIVNLIIMFVSMITFDMATTAINNYCDYKNELKHSSEKYNGKNPMFVYNISENVGLLTIFILLTTAIITGIILSLKTNLLVLLIGIICFFVGIFYTFGPIPISRMPLGEIFSGIFMGFIIPFLTIYVSTYDRGYFGIYIDNYVILARFNIIEIITIFLVTVPIIGGIANIMLANNICDLEEDIKVGRYTLPYYIGKKISINLFKYIYYFGYIVILLSIFIDILPKVSILTILSLYIVQKNIIKFEEKQIKSQTFINSVKNFTFIGLFYVISIFVSFI